MGKKCSGIRKLLSVWSVRCTCWLDQIKAGQVRSRSFIGQRTIYYGLSLISLQWTDMIETDNCIEIQNSVCPKSPAGVQRDQAKVSQWITINRCGPSLDSIYRCYICNCVYQLKLYLQQGHWVLPINNTNTPGLIGLTWFTFITLPKELCCAQKSSVVPKSFFAYKNTLHFLSVKFQYFYKLFKTNV